MFWVLGFGFWVWGLGFGVEPAGSEDAPPQNAPAPTTRRPAIRPHHLHRIPGGFSSGIHFLRFLFSVFKFLILGFGVCGIGTPPPPAPQPMVPTPCIGFSGLSFFWEGGGGGLGFGVYGLGLRSWARPHCPHPSRSSPHLTPASRLRARDLEFEGLGLEVED